MKNLFLFRTQAARGTVRRSFSRGGFTLVEVMLAMAVVSIGIIGILALFPNALQSSRDAADSTLAATIAQDAISELRVAPFSTLTNSATANVTTQEYTVAGFSTNTGTGYYRLKRDCVSTGNPDLVRVTANIIWPAQSSKPVTNIFVTFIANYDRP